MAPKIGVALERERDVRQRADREQVQIVDGAGDVAEVGDRVVRRFGPREVGECRIAETGVAVNAAAVDGSARERQRRTPVDRHVEAGHLRDDQRVACRPVDPDVAGDGRDADQVGVARRDQDRDRVIESGIAVEDELHWGSGACLATSWPSPDAGGGAGAPSGWSCY